jgi:hypothetical protein
MVDTVQSAPAPEFKVDISKPASAAEFEAHGASPAQAAMLAEQHEAAAGRRGSAARAFFSVTDPAPPGAKLPPGARVTQTEASSALQAHESAQLSAHLAGEVFKPPAQPQDYSFPCDVVDQSDAEFAQDGELKQAAFAEGLPKMFVDNLAQAVRDMSRRVNETHEQARSHFDAQVARLETIWGKDTDANLAKVGTFKGQLLQRYPGFAQQIDIAFHAATPLDLDMLVQWLNHRAVRR